MKFKKFTVKDSTYEYAFDDHCIVLKVGKNKVWINPVILPKLDKLAKRLKEKEKGYLTDNTGGLELEDANISIVGR